MSNKDEYIRIQLKDSYYCGVSLDFIPAINSKVNLSSMEKDIFHHIFLNYNSMSYAKSKSIPFEISIQELMDVCYTKCRKSVYNAVEYLKEAKLIICLNPNERGKRKYITDNKLINQYLEEWRR